VGWQSEVVFGDWFADRNECGSEDLVGFGRTLGSDDDARDDGKRFGYRRGRVMLGFARLC